MAAPPLTLIGLGHALGTLAPIDEALAGRVSPELMAKLHEEGFANIAIAPQGPIALAREAAEHAIADAELEPTQIDAVVYATCSYFSDPRGSSSTSHDRVGLGGLVAEGLLRPLRLQHAQLHGVFLAESGNLASALRVARNLLALGEHRTVLVVTADAVPDRPDEFRAMPSGVAINSDAAAAAILTRTAMTDKPRRYRVHGIEQSSSSRMLTFVKGQGLAKYLEIIAGIRRAVGQLVERTETATKDYQHLVTNNYSRQTLHGFADATGVPRERLFTDNIARFAHGFSADPLINVIDLERQGATRPGDRILFLCTGPQTWGAVSVQRC